MNKGKSVSFQSLVTIAIILLFTTNCSKDDQTPSDNPTNGKTTAVLNPALQYGTLTDQDGNTYKTTVIGNQTWMATRKPLLTGQVINLTLKEDGYSRFLSDRIYIFSKIIAVLSGEIVQDIK